MADLKKYRKAVDEAKAEAQVAHVAFVKARDDFHAEGHDITDETSEAFKQISEIHEAKAHADQKAAMAEDRYVRLLEMESPSDAPKFDQDADDRGRQAKAIQTAADNVLQSEAYKALVASGKLNGSVGKVELDAVKAIARAELKTLITGLSSTSGGAFVVEDRQGGFVNIERKPRRMLDLVTIGETDSDMVEYVKVTSRTNNAAETAEATSSADGAAPESAIAFAVVQESVKEIKHFIPATRRALADAGQLRTIIDSELIEGVLERLDTQLATGDGTGENLTGLLATAGIQSQVKSTDSWSDAYMKAMTKVRLAYYEPDAIALHPNNWEDLRLEKDANGNYIYGPPSMQGATSIWGLPAVATVSITEDNPVLGAFKRGANFWLREGVQVAATDSHDDWFIRGIIAVLASMRGAFGVTRPTAFCEITLS